MRQSNRAEESLGKFSVDLNNLKMQIENKDNALA